MPATGRPRTRTPPPPPPWPSCPPHRGGVAAARQELADSFSGTLQFGTAGLRAALGPGPNRMNRVVVRRAAAGFAAFLTDAVAQASPGTRPRAVVGYDARHNSDIFAEETAAILTAAGIETFLMPAALPTPLLAYAVRALDCDGGVMVTASHNPPQDNGYKVYLGRHAVEESGRGAQIVAPYDALIAAKIDAVGALDSIVLAADGWTVLEPSIAADYQARRRGPGGSRALPGPRAEDRPDPHARRGRGNGRGGAERRRIRRRHAGRRTGAAGSGLPHGELPEPGGARGAGSGARGGDARGRRHRDRQRSRRRPGRGGREGSGHRRLADAARRRGGRPARRAHRGAPGAAGRRPGAKAPAGVFANSIVSSRLLARIAAAAGYAHEETLTGFKWISRVPGLVYGYEEALGYCVAPALVRDKDGISAAVLIAELAAAAKAAGKTIFDTLDELYLVHGLHASDQLSIRVADLGLLDAMMNRLRVSPPESFGGSGVEAVTDLAEGSEHLPPTEGLLYLTRDLSRVIIRPSGTEPKLKCYLEVIRSVGSAAELPAARDEARPALDARPRGRPRGPGL